MGIVSWVQEKHRVVSMSSRDGPQQTDAHVWRRTHGEYVENGSALKVSERKWATQTPAHPHPRVGLYDNV